MSQTKETGAPRTSDGFRIAQRVTARIGQLLEQPVSALLTLAVVLVSLAPLVQFLQIAFARIGYPFELEWLEGGTVTHIRVAMAGKSIYREPTLEFTPFLYPPLYYYVSAIPSFFLGVGHLAPRFVSLVSICGAFALLARWVRAQTGDLVAGVVAAGLLASVYQLTCCWFDLARVDSLFLVLTMAANVVAQTAQTPRRAIAAGALLAAACLTKQVGIPMALPALVLITVRSWRLGLRATLAAGAVLFVAGAALMIGSKGWAFFYLFALPSRHRIEWQRFVPDVQTYFGTTTLPLTIAGVAVLCGFGFARHQRMQWIYNALFVLLSCVTSLLPFLKSGGYPNGLIPAYAALALAAGLLFGSLRRQSSSSAGGRIGVGVLGLCVVLFQCNALRYDSALALPTAEDRAANEKAVALIASLPKPIWVTASSNYTQLAEPGGSLLEAVAVTDVLKGGGPVAERLTADLQNALREHRFRTIVGDRALAFLPGEVAGVVSHEYRVVGSVMPGVGGTVAWPKTGAWIRPDQIYTPRSH